jgi:hypothetical protein
MTPIWRAWLLFGFAFVNSSLLPAAWSFAGADLPILLLVGLLAGGLVALSLSNLVEHYREDGRRAARGMEAS